MEEASQKYGDNITVFNVAVDKNMKQYVNEKLGKKLPFVVHKKAII